MAVVYPQEGRKKDLTQMEVGTHLLVLFQSNTTPGTLTTFADLTLATFSGYSPFTVTWSTVAINGDGNATNATPAYTFTHNGGATSNNIYGWALVLQEAGPVYTLKSAERFADAPRSMAAAGNSIYVAVTRIQGTCP